jgi:hypothetical protein
MSSAKSDICAEENGTERRGEEERTLATTSRTRSNNPAAGRFRAKSGKRVPGRKDGFSFKSETGKDLKGEGSKKRLT